ncbi:protein kinase family protein [Actinoallomurus rhizosphaericola]|uniref:hypothetical protein n=1 Tax=Actinoallomurus rhizosphaericola TaxID=2952536 RepID=UPI002093CADA|nr:hypothetical protein [Actinoallomurus rhizosphaericola]MCO5997616.1 hypothetical protein [Actinoallomurus rhizosphaericola]
MRSGLEVAGRYRLDAPLGHGSTGEVRQGIVLRLLRPVAVKVLLLNGATDGGQVARFWREAGIPATLNHPGITTVFDIDENTNGGPRMPGVSPSRSRHDPHRAGSPAGGTGMFEMGEA